MVLPTVMFYFGGVHLSLDVLRACGYKAPFRISSTPKGSVMPTALYVLIEDVVAVDGGGGQVYRYALRTRYLSSPYFRRMLFEMNCFWGGGSVIFAAAITAIIFTTPRPIAYTVSFNSLLWAAHVLMMHSWDGLYHLYGRQSGPASPSHGSKVTSVAKRKLGAKAGSREAFPSPTTSPRQPPGLASAPSKKTYHTFCHGSARNSRTRRHLRKANHPRLPNESFKTLLLSRPLTPVTTLYTHAFFL